jgi:hypothetical protein
MKIFFLSLAGVLFSGYLSAIKLFSNTCALNEPCPYFWGYPACWYGFGMFLVLFICSIIVWAKPKAHWANLLRDIIAACGIVFAGYFTLPEISKLLDGGSWYTLGLPTCAYGLIFYILIFIFSIKKAD